jgi:site-specific DNA-methyltransferase (adenine-specific)
MTVIAQQQIIDTQGNVIPIDDAWERHKRIVGYRNLAEKTFLALGEELHEFDENKQWETMGYSSFSAYLAHPDVDISRPVAVKIMLVYKKYILSLNCSQGNILDAGYKKLYMLEPHVDQNNVGEWVTKASVLSRSDLKIEIDEAFPPPPPSPLPDGQYRIIYADPPWKYSDKLIENYGAANHHYPQMTIEQLCKLKVIDIAGDNSVLFMWVTSPLLEDVFQVIKAWGFEYKTSFVWDKVKHNYGHYNSVRHEFLLICTRGSCTPDKKELYDSVQTIERSDKHSEKPEEFRKIIDDLYPQGERIELFARKKIDGWDAWGNEAG